MVETIKEQRKAIIANMRSMQKDDLIKMYNSINLTLWERIRVLDVDAEVMSEIIEIFQDHKYTERILIDAFKEK